MPTASGVKEAVSAAEPISFQSPFRPEMKAGLEASRPSSSRFRLSGMSLDLQRQRHRVTEQDHIPVQDQHWQPPLPSGRSGKEVGRKSNVSLTMTSRNEKNKGKINCYFFRSVWKVSEYPKALVTGRQGRAKKKRSVRPAGSTATNWKTIEPTRLSRQESFFVRSFELLALLSRFQYLGLSPFPTWPAQSQGNRTRPLSIDRHADQTRRPTARRWTAHDGEGKGKITHHFYSSFFSFLFFLFLHSTYPPRFESTDGPLLKWPQGLVSGTKDQPLRLPVRLLTSTSRPKEEENLIAPCKWETSHNLQCWTDHLPHGPVTGLDPARFAAGFLAYNAAHSAPFLFDFFPTKVDCKILWPCLAPFSDSFTGTPRYLFPLDFIQSKVSVWFGMEAISQQNQADRPRKIIDASSFPF